MNASREFFTSDREALRNQLQHVRFTFRAEYAHWPDPFPVSTPGQEALRLKHGTPKEFMNNCADAISELSYDEAARAVSQYKFEWDNA